MSHRLPRLALLFAGGVITVTHMIKIIKLKLKLKSVWEMLAEISTGKHTYSTVDHLKKSIAKNILKNANCYKNKN